MARLARLPAAGFPQHVIQRGNNRQVVFHEDADYVAYLGWLQDAARANDVAIHGYVLMPNHVHLLATPGRDDGIGRMMQSLGRRYVRWHNDKYRRSGALWDGRYRAALVEAERYLLACLRYIELNPVRAGLVELPQHYRWSSCAHHVGMTVDPLITDHALVWALGNTPYARQSAYRALLEEPLPASDVDSLRAATNRGRALGSTEFLQSVGADRIPAQLPRPRGRPPRKDHASGESMH